MKNPFQSAFTGWKDHHDRLAAVAIERVHLGGTFAIYRLFNRYYLKSFIGPFFAFIFPVLVYGILGSLLNPYLLFAGVTAMSAMSSGITAMPFSLIELKKSTLLKRIGASPVKPLKFTLAIISYFVVITVLSNLWLMIWALLFQRNPGMFNALGTVPGFFGFFYGGILNIIMSLSIGFAIATLSKNEVAAQALGMLVFLPCAFLCGQFVPINIVSDNLPMEWISRFLPFRYTTMIITEGWNGDLPANLIPLIPNASSFGPDTFKGNPFLIHDYAALNASITFDPQGLIDAPDKQQFVLQSLADHKWAQIVYDKPDHIVAYIYPYAIIAGSTAFSTLKFSWSSDR